VTVSTPTVAPETRLSGAAPTVEPTPLWAARTTNDARLQAAVRAAQPDYWAWLHHVTPAGGCTQPIRLAGAIHTVEADTGRIQSTVDTPSMPDGVIYKPCGNRRASVCPHCSKVYQRDAYQVLRTGLVGGKGVPEERATHPAVFPTFTAPGFGPVHTRHVVRHTCTNRRLCDCRPEPCYPRRDAETCEHGQQLVCFARHELDDPRLGTPLCLDCYDYPHQVVWNMQAPELWRRTTLAMTRHIRRTAKARGLHPRSVRLSFGKVAEMQRRGVAHFHAIIRLDGTDPVDQAVTLSPPAELGVADLLDALEYARLTIRFTTPAHPGVLTLGAVHDARPDGWVMAWGDQFEARIVNVGVDGEITDAMVAAYLAKYATKSTEATGFIARRITDDTLHEHANMFGTHAERIVEACWYYGTPTEWRGLRRWAHMLGFGGHFLTKSRTYSITFTFLREARAVWRREHSSGPADEDQAVEEPTTLIVNFLKWVGSGWHTTGDALLAATAADMARRRREAARDAATHAIAA
jgi:hypothetical protein